MPGRAKACLAPCPHTAQELLGAIPGDAMCVYRHLLQTCIAVSSCWQVPLLLFIVRSLFNQCFLYVRARA